MENLIEVNINQDIAVKCNRLVGTRTFEVGQKLLIVFLTDCRAFYTSIVDSQVIVAKQSRQTPLTTRTNMVKDRADIVLLEDTKDTADTSIGKT